VIPLISATRTVRSRVDEMRQSMEGRQNHNGSYSNEENTDYSKNESKPAKSKGDYIDFEEIK